jgi:hypothetical protein
MTSLRARARGSSCAPRPRRRSLAGCIRPTTTTIGTRGRLSSESPVAAAAKCRLKSVGTCVETRPPTSILIIRVVPSVICCQFGSRPTSASEPRWAMIRDAEGRTAWTAWRDGPTTPAAPSAQQGFGRMGFPAASVSTGAGRHRNNPDRKPSKRRLRKGLVASGKGDDGVYGGRGCRQQRP